MVHLAMLPHSGANELIPLTTAGDGTQAVMGRDLHAFLEIKTAYKDWFPRMVEYGFSAGQDYLLKNERVQDSLGREREALNHVVSLDMAKEISMIQRTEKGKQARQYFLECERRAKETASPRELSGRELMARALVEADATIRELETTTARQAAELEAAAPKAEAYDAFIDADGTYSVGSVAKMLGLSQNKLFDLLRNTGALIAKGPMRNTPYQKYMHHFAVKAYEYERSNGARATSYTTRVQPSGVDFIRKKINQAGAAA